jgi:hypothetical protein
VPVPSTSQPTLGVLVHVKEIQLTAEETELALIKDLTLQIQLIFTNAKESQDVLVMLMEDTVIITIITITMTKLLLHH